MDADAPGRPTPGHDPRFRSTRWGVVLAAAGGPSAEAHEALADLCAEYWYPLYAFARRRGHGPEAAEDLVQGYFARLLEKGAWPPSTGPGGGSGRTWWRSFSIICTIV